MTHSTQWLNPPSDSWPEHRALVELDTGHARIAAEALAAAADAVEDTDTERARVLRKLAHQLTLACLTPAQANAQGVSEMDTMHPANQYSRLIGTALVQLSRWSGPVSLVANAIEKAAAIAAGRDGEKGLRELIAATHDHANALHTTAFGPLIGDPVGPIGTTEGTR